MACHIESHDPLGDGLKMHGLASRQRQRKLRFCLAARRTSCKPVTSPMGTAAQFTGTCGRAIYWLTKGIRARSIFRKVDLRHWYWIWPRPSAGYLGSDPTWRGSNGFGGCRATKRNGEARCQRNQPWFRGQCSSRSGTWLKKSRAVSRGGMVLRSNRLTTSQITRPDSSSCRPWPRGRLMGPNKRLHKDAASAAPVSLVVLRGDDEKKCETG